MNWVSIDFGTSYSSATVLIDGKPAKVHPIGGLYNMYGFPTVAYVDENRNIKVCNEALPWRCQNPDRFLKDFKLNIHEDEVAYLGVHYVEIIEQILRYIKKSAEYAIGNETIEGVVITIPATYAESDPRKEIMRDAAQRTGFTNIEFVKEAEAAAVYYHSIQKGQTNSITLIYDLGGGTFDPALVEHRDNSFVLLGSASGKECGGKYFEAALYRYFKEKYSFTYSDDEAIKIQQIDGIARLCKDIKEALSSTEEVSYPVPLMGKTTITCTRREFEDLIQPLLEQTFQECSSLIASSGKQWKDVSRILLIGGSSTIPCVKSFLKQYITGQNNAEIPIVLNKSEEGVLIDSLFAVSIGGLISHYSASTASPTPSESPVSDEDFLFKLAMSYKKGHGIAKNWVKAAFYFNKDFVATQREASYENVMEIYQYLLDRLELENGSLVFQSIVNTVGEDAVDSLVEMLLCLQTDLDTRGYKIFVKEIFDVDYWIPITEAIIKNQETR